MWKMIIFEGDPIWPLSYQSTPDRFIQDLLSAISPSSLSSSMHPPTARPRPVTLSLFVFCPASLTRCNSTLFLMPAKNVSGSFCSRCVRIGVRATLRDFCVLGHLWATISNVALYFGFLTLAVPIIIYGSTLAIFSIFTILKLSTSSLAFFRRLKGRNSLWHVVKIVSFYQLLSYFSHIFLLCPLRWFLSVWDFCKRPDILHLRCWAFSSATAWIPFLWEPP